MYKIYGSTVELWDQPKTLLTVTYPGSAKPSHALVPSSNRAGSGKFEGRNGANALQATLTDLLQSGPPPCGAHPLRCIVHSTDNHDDHPSSPLSTRWVWPAACPQLGPPPLPSRECQANSLPLKCPLRNQDNRGHRLSMHGRASSGMSAQTSTMFAS